MNQKVNKRASCQPFFSVCCYAIVFFNWFSRLIFWLNPTRWEILIQPVFCNHELRGKCWLGNTRNHALLTISTFSKWLFCPVMFMTISDKMFFFTQWKKLIFYHGPGPLFSLKIRRYSILCKLHQKSPPSLFLM